jgi:predicted nucleotidyltransferase component of viral defense system
MKKEDQAKSIAAKLSKISRTKGINYQNISTTFLLERLLARLVADRSLAKSLVFKGGYVGLRVYNSNRYTIDLDALLVKADITATLKKSAKAIEKDIHDGAWFILESQINLKTQGEYGGVRQVYRAGIGDIPNDIKRAQIINFDLGIGDPVTPGPVIVKTDELIGDVELSWQVYPIETIIAEKLQTLIMRGNDNSRAKDVFDLHHYLPGADRKILLKAVESCFEFRETPLPQNIHHVLSSMDRTMLERGWKTATASLKNPPTFNDAFESILKDLKLLFPSDSDKKKKTQKIQKRSKK